VGQHARAIILGAMPKRPDLFIIGAAKAGTTSLYEYLRGHPEVFMSPAKEPRYFAPDLDSGSGHDLHYPDDEDRYLALFEGARDEKRLGEASVRYIYSVEAPRLINDFQPSAFIVAMVRNPVETIYSLHNQYVSDGAEEIADFERALEAEEDRRRGGPGGGVNRRLLIYRDRGRFADQLPRWFDTFGRERVHVIVFEDMVADPAGTFRALLEFLQVDPDYQPESFAAYNASHAPRSRLLLRLTKSRPMQWLVWKLLPRVVGERATRALVRSYRNSPVKRRSAQRAPLAPDLRRRLEEEFAPDVAQLSRLLGRDLAALWFQ
jgi:hypothetical protein